MSNKRHYEMKESDHTTIHRYPAEIIDAFKQLSPEAVELWDSLEICEFDGGIGDESLWMICRALTRLNEWATKRGGRKRQRIARIRRLSGDLIEALQSRVDVAYFEQIDSERGYIPHSEITSQ